MKLVCVLTLLLSVGAPGVLAERGMGAKFGARDARTCTSLKEPGKGAPTADQLKQYFVCFEEKITKSFGSGETLHLISDLTMEVGKSRPFNMATDSWLDSDPTQLVYPVRGGYTSWGCYVLGTINGERGKNCVKFEQPHAVGVCYKNSFGDWHCRFVDGTATPSSNALNLSPPPTGK